MDEAKVVVAKPRKRGRPVVEVPEGFEILSNGLYKYQWEWLKAYGERSMPRQDGAAIQRMAVQWFIDGVAPPVAEVLPTPEQDKDFEQLIQKKVSKSKNKSNSKTSSRRK